MILFGFKAKPAGNGMATEHAHQHSRPLFLDQ